jgi:hypothetical protein
MQKISVMIQTENPKQHQLMKEIVALTLQLKTQYPELYVHLSETPVFESDKPGNEIASMEDYRNTLDLQLKNADGQNKQNRL